MANVRKVEPRDLAQVAYMILKWDSELPEWCQQVQGVIARAERAAQIIVSGDGSVSEGYVLEEGGEVIGGCAVVKAVGIFSPNPYGQLLMWYVLPEHRGKLHGLRLLKKAMEVSKECGLEWLEAYPWADDAGAAKVLERLGFKYAVNSFMLRT